MVALSVFLLGTLAGAERSYAVSLPIGSAVVAVGEAEPGLGANPVATTGPVNFFAGTYSGTLTSTVYNQDPTNPNGPNALTFAYVIHNNANSAHELHRFTVSSFENFTTDVSFSSLLPGLAPTFVDRSPGIGDVVGFSYPTPIPPVLLGPGPISPGLTTAVMIVQTNATLFQPTMAAVIDGTVTMVESLAPAALIPEPSTLVLMALGAGSLFAVRRRGRRV